MLPLLAEAPAELAKRLGGPGRAAAVFAALRSGDDPFDSLAPRARERLASAVAPLAARVRHTHEAPDGTLKMLVALEDARDVECVLIPSGARTTLCLSTQVGCARACTFCLTATMGLVRNLSTAEILAQVALALRAARARPSLPPLTNVVFMGMGEPLDNLEALAPALAALTDNAALGFGARHVTVSTVGPSPRAVAGLAHLPGNVAWSLHAADDAKRRHLVPTARHAPSDLLHAFAQALSARGPKEVLFVELTLIDALNDSEGDAAAVLRLFEGFAPEVRFNLLPMNPIPGAAHRPSPPERVEAFAARLRDAGYLTVVRRARGREALAACGQLATLATRR